MASGWPEVMPTGSATHYCTVHSVAKVLQQWRSYCSEGIAAVKSLLWCYLYLYTVEPLTNVHPHQRPSLSYDHISCDGPWFLFVYESLTSDHPSYTTTPMWFWGWSYKRGSTVLHYLQSQRKAYVFEGSTVQSRADHSYWSKGAIVCYCT